MRTEIVRLSKESVIEVGNLTCGEYFENISPEYVFMKVENDRDIPVAVKAVRIPDGVAYTFRPDDEVRHLRFKLVEVPFE